MKPFYQDNHNTLYHSDFLDNDLPDESVQMVVTSPPYWGLRKYEGDQDLIWGGGEHCEHEWLMTRTTREEYRRQGHINEGWNGFNRQEHPEWWEKVELESGTCIKCGAWKGGYGQEPDVKMYVEHTIVVLREIRRVLRKDGVVFLNLGDSYASGGKNPSQSLPSRHVPACGTDGKGFLNWMECGCACSCHDDERQAASKICTSRSGQQAGITASPSCKTVRDRLHRDSVLASAGGVPHVSQESNNSASSPASPANPSVRFCSDCLKSHYLASETSNPLGTLYHIPKLKAKDLCLIPFRVAIAAQEDGWWVRSIIIWSKPNPMPESARDRPSESHEYILMLTKSARYYWDAEAVREPQTGNAHSRGTEACNAEYQEKRDSYKGFNSPSVEVVGGRNIRSVWTFPTQPFPSQFVQGKQIDHFAVYPEKLPETCIKAATPEEGCCAECGAPYKRIVEKEVLYRRQKSENEKYPIKPIDGAPGIDRRFDHEYEGNIKTIGWKPTCRCQTDRQPVPATVLDPFSGSGTTIWVAKRLNRIGIGFEISEEYCRLTVDRIRQQGLL